MYRITRSTDRILKFPVRELAARSMAVPATNNYFEYLKMFIFLILSLEVGYY
jgi:hypothetical protein